MQQTSNIRSNEIKRGRPMDSMINPLTRKWNETINHNLTSLQQSYHHENIHSFPKLIRFKQNTWLNKTLKQRVHRIAIASNSHNKEESSYTKLCDLTLNYKPPFGQNTLIENSKVHSDSILKEERV